MMEKAEYQMKKILVICGSLGIGGAEKVSADLCLYAPKDQFEFHYLVFEGLGDEYGREIEKRGGKVLSWPSPSCGYWDYYKRLKRLMKKNQYSAVHSHTMFNSGINLFVAKRCGVPVRIAHSHTTKTETKVPVRHKIYEIIMRIVVSLCATHLFACGVAAGEWMFGEKTFRKKGTVIHNGIDTRKFKYSPSYRQAIRKKLDMEDSFIIGHTGVLSTLKNQAFLIKVMPEIIRKIPNARLVLLGYGNNRNVEKLREIIDDLHLEEHVLLNGVTNCVEQFLSAFDVFAFPSLREGTPLALIEAQCNGLPCIVSSNVPRDVFISDLIQSVSLDRQEEWIRLLTERTRHDAEKYADYILNKGYDVHRTYEYIYQVYDGKAV